ncbi:MULTISPECIES: thioredoxin domain-containing protein [Burkholderiaceae]|uniref:Thioredoxin domain-containing protein n=1 Tax=Burkholderia cepacia TaxID=292 RepID=A0A8I1ARN0_BURCE|nr:MULTISPECIES: thioredoxin domain-containing protein [Burkholderiaceae]MBB0025230.1 disulfide bond formation protein DsbA [Ralstonia pickettii]MBB0036018.1 disulfide bond formation protein DsbA [Ralstonia pickettii]MBB0098558.1 disulfide bond formation protein DsbA [Ralstonia pickettii]MBB0108383.1 disulfide bond formation protein DsbA [Ralstonia pickettii]MBB0129332.1 disulfide bond formation protein DsbA [Ralstonia pickettii]
MRPLNLPDRGTLRRFAKPVTIAATCVLLLWLAWRLAAPTTSDTSGAAVQTTDSVAAPTGVATSGPPWRYGRADARYTVVEYADLECPFCRAYFAVLKHWIDTHGEVNWQWHHLPLSVHEPAASADARLVECVGETNGAAAFWKAVAWVYENTRGDGQGLPEALRYPGLTAGAQRCLTSERPDAAIRAQMAAAAKDGIQVTPTLRLLDHKTGKTLVLHGPVEGDALLSAIDLLAAGGTDPASKEMPAEPLGDMPR